MNICMFTNTYLPHIGGVARSVQTFASDLRQRGHRVLIIAPVFPGWEKHDKTEADVVRVPAIQEINGSDFSLRLPVPFFLDEKIDEFKPDIIHSHHPYLLGDSAFRAARKRQLPLVFTHHTLYEEYTHHLNIDSDALKQFAAILSTRYTHLCHHVISPSQSVARMMVKRGVSCPITEIPTGVDIDFFAGGNEKRCRSSLGIPKQARVIGHVGRLSEEKNLIYLAGAVADAVSRLPDSIFLVVGDGSEKEEISRIFEQRNLSHKLVMTGSLSGRDLADAYQTMDLFVFASHSETQGMVVAEAMAAGNPVLALDASGVREVLKDRQNGRLLNQNSSGKQFAQVLKGILDKPKQLKQWALNAEKTAALLSRSKSASRLLDLYTTVLDRHQENLAPADSDMDQWESFILGLQAEWDLLVEKAGSLLETAQQKGHEI